MLVAMGIAAGLAEWIGGPELWGRMPGAMPYFTVLDTPEVLE
jgi:hypothetical protein